MDFWYVNWRLYPDFLELCLDSLNNFSLDECFERQDSIDRGICPKIDGGWFDFLM